MIVFSFSTDVGKVREKNEDAFGHFKDEFFLIADGLGGLPAGEIAAQLAIQTAIEAYKKSKDLQRAFEMANHEIFLQSQKFPAYFGMATTLVGAAIEGSKATLANVGDSRAYLISGGKISQITIDHGLGMGIVTRVLGINPEVNVDIFKKDLKPGNSLLLCTDGLTNMLTDEEIFEIIKNSENTENVIGNKVQELIDSANVASGNDNITVCLIERT